MSNDLDMFKGNALVNSDMFKDLLESAKRLAGGGRGYRRISIRGGRFREIVDGEQMNVNSSGSMNVVVLESAPVARFFYEGAYDPDKTTAPTCWSEDTQKPSDDVPEDHKQANRCMDCPQNVKGSGQGESRACRFSQRIALALEGQLDKVYQMQLPATSLFGEVKDGKMPMQAYAKFLVENKMPPIAVVTQMYFDEDSETPKLFFKPVRPLEEEELNECIKLRDSEETKAALDLSVAQTDSAGSKSGKAFEIEESDEPKAAKKEKKEKKAKKDKEKKAKVEDVEEPTKVSKKAKEEVAESDSDLESLVSEWDDD